MANPEFPGVDYSFLDESAHGIYPPVYIDQLELTINDNHELVPGEIE